MKILVTGATGGFGGRVIETLLTSIPTEQVIASVRDLSKAQHLIAKGIEVRQADFSDSSSLDKAFNGIDKVLIISTTEPNNDKRIEQHINAVNAAKKANVKQILYTSGTKADTTTLAMGLAHKATEKAIIESGIPYTILRNNMYLETEFNTVRACLSSAPIITNAGVGKIGFALRKDYADAAATVLIEDSHENKIYELSGKPTNYEELAVEIGKAIGKNIPVKHVNDEEFATFLKGAGIPEVMIPMLTATKSAVKGGVLHVESNDLEMLLKRPVTPTCKGIEMLVEMIGK